MRGKKEVERMAGEPLRLTGVVMDVAELRRRYTLEKVGPGLYRAIEKDPKNNKRRK